MESLWKAENPQKLRRGEYEGQIDNGVVTVSYGCPRCGTRRALSSRVPLVGGVVPWTLPSCPACHQSYRVVLEGWCQ